MKAEKRSDWRAVGEQKMKLTKTNYMHTEIFLYIHIFILF